jgi:uncharacterized membrane protein
MAEDILKEIDENEQKIEWTIKQLKPGQSDDVRGNEAINLLDELENEKLELEKREAEKKQSSFSERIALFYMRLFGSLFFVVLFIFFVAFWIGANYYLNMKSMDTFFNLTILNTVMVALAVLQMPFIMISLRIIQKKEYEQEAVDYERERLAIKLQTLEAEDLRNLDSEHTMLQDEHEKIRVSIEKLQESIDDINSRLGNMVEDHNQEKKDVDEEVFRDEEDESDEDSEIRGRARVVDFDQKMPKAKEKEKSDTSNIILRPGKRYEINEDFMDNFKREINQLKRKEQKGPGNKQKKSPKKSRPQKKKKDNAKKAKKHKKKKSKAKQR